MNDSPFWRGFRRGFIGAHLALAPLAVAAWAVWKWLA